LPRLLNSVEPLTDSYFATLFDFDLSYLGFGEHLKKSFLGSALRGENVKRSDELLPLDIILGQKFL
jgi:hypothetical protein